MLVSEFAEPVAVVRAIASLASLVIVAWLILRPGTRNPVRGAAFVDLVHTVAREMPTKH